MVISIAEKRKSDSDKMQCSTKKRKTRTVKASHRKRNERRELNPLLSSKHNYTTTNILQIEPRSLSSEAGSNEIYDKAELLNRLQPYPYEDSCLLSDSSLNNYTSSSHSKTSSIAKDSSMKNMSLEDDDAEIKKKRWWKTAMTLKESGLLNITMRTAELLKKNQDLQREIESLQKETQKFVVSVMSNPENSSIAKKIGSKAQLYELIVPGSQSIMSVPIIKSQNNFDQCLSSSKSSNDDNFQQVPSPQSADSESSPPSSPNTGSSSNDCTSEEDS